MQLHLHNSMLIKGTSWIRCMIHTILPQQALLQKLILLQEL
jgi:hypothetical protein